MEFMIYETLKPFILASNSPRRKDFLSELGLDFTIEVREIDESPRHSEDPVRYVERMARQKASAVAALFPTQYIVAADTAVCLGETILGKPRDERDAVNMLMMLAGRAHVVRSGICLLNRQMEREQVVSVATEVFFTDFSEPVARSYVEEGESMDKAGAYGIQGKGAFLVRRISGSYTNVVGLPLAEVVELLQEDGIIRCSVE